MSYVNIDIIIKRNVFFLKNVRKPGYLLVDVFAFLVGKLPTGLFGLTGGILTFRPGRPDDLTGPDPG